MNIPKFSVHHSVTATMVILLIVVLGFVSYTRLGLDLMPDITYPIISVAVGYPGVTPEDIENVLTKPLEEVISTVKNVKKVNSVSLEGFSVISVEFEWGTNIDMAAQDIRDSIDFMKSYALPADISKPIVYKFDISMIPLLEWGVIGGEDRSLKSLLRVSKDVLKNKLEQVDGVASVLVYGGEEEEVLIEIDRQKLDSLGISMDDIIMRLASENINVPGGYVEDGHREYILRTLAEFRDIEEIKNIPITVKSKVPIYVKDVADVQKTAKEARSFVRTNTKNSVLLIVSKESGANTVLVSNKIKKEMKNIKKLLPEDIKVMEIFDQATFINRMISATTSNAVVGGILAVIVLYFFLWNWRPTLAIALNIPLSILGTFIFLYFAGQTLNFITMAGLALGVGMLVDNSIVVIENIYRHFKEGKDRINASIDGASEVGMAITASTLTTVVVFLPLFFAKGITGKIFEGLGITVSVSLIASLLVSLTIIPVMVSKILTRSGRTLDHGKSSKWEARVINPIKNVYTGILRKALHNKKKTLMIVFGSVVVCALVAVFFTGKEFFPEMDNNMSMGSIRLPVGTSVEETNRITNLVENILMNQEGIEVVGGIVGVGEGQEIDASMGTGATGVHEAQLFIKLVDKKYRKKSSVQIFKEIKRKTPEFDGVKIEFRSMGSAMMLGGQNQKPVDIKIFGKDLNMLTEIANQISVKLEGVKGITNISNSAETGKPELKISIDREKAIRSGLTVGLVAQTIKTAFQGKVATKYRSGGDEFDVKVRFRKEDRNSIEDIGKIGVMAQGFSPMARGSVPLKELARIEYGAGYVNIKRENQKRVVSVTADIVGRDLAGVIGDAKKVIGKIVLPEGYFVQYSGEAQQMFETFRDLGLILLLALVLIYMVMAAEFESLVHPFVIMFTVPFAFVGVILALFFTGKPISLPAGMGGLILSGTIVNNGIVLVDYINQLIRRGKEKIEAIIEAGNTRLRPVLMTALTTILGMIPMAISRSEGAEMRSVVSVSIIGGLFIGTVLTLIVLPVIYIIIDDWSQKFGAKLRFLVRREK